MNLTALYRCYNNKSGAQQVNPLVISAVTYIIQNYFLAATTSFVLTLSCGSKHNCDYFYQFLSKLYAVNGCQAIIQLVVVRDNLRQHIPGRRYYNLIMTDSFQAFKQIDAISYTKHYNYNEFYHILLQAPAQNLLEDTQNILEYCWLNQIIHCNVQFENARHEIQIYTYQPYTEQHCGKITAMPVNRYNGTAWSDEQLFPDKLQNLHGCALRVATWDVPPFVYVETDRSGHSRITGGFEGLLVQMLAKALNFSIVVKIPPNDEQRGAFFNNTVNGALLMLHRRTADMSMGCFREDSDRSANATSVTSYYLTMEAICVLVAGYDLTSFQILRFPFAPNAWLFIFAILGLALLVPAFARKQLFASYARLYLEIIGILFGLPTFATSASMHARILSTSWALFTLILRSFYSALLFHLIRARITNHMPTSLAELVEYNYTVVMNRGTYEALTDVPYIRDLPQMKLNTRNETVAFAYIEDMPEQKLAAAGPLEFILYYGHYNHKAGVFQLLPQNILNLHTTMYLTKHSFLADKFMEKIMWIRAAGLIQAWADWELQKGYFKSGGVIVGKKFSLNELYMIFVILMWGLGIALVVFLLEMFLKRCKYFKFK